MRRLFRIQYPKPSLPICAVPLLLASVYAAAPATQPANPAAQPADPAMDWILSHATPATAPSPDDSPTAGPATLPAVLQSSGAARDESRPAVLVLSNGVTLAGQLFTTLRQPIRIWDAGKQEYQDLPFSLIQSIEVRVISETQDPEWKFAQSGSDVKEFSGRTYPARQTDYAVTLTDGTTVTGAVAGPIYYLDNAGTQKVFILHKRDKGEAGQKLEELVYVKAIHFSDKK